MICKAPKTSYSKPKGQILKWVGNKYRFAEQITSIFPDFNNYYEPFLGTGAVLATIQHHKSFACDTLSPLIDFWNILQTSPGDLIEYYSANITEYYKSPKEKYFTFLNSFNAKPNGFDLMMISRTCYGGVIRFTLDGKISTPPGPHKPIPPEAFSLRALEWSKRIESTVFKNCDYSELLSKAKSGDLVYCDPPYVDSQKILYGAQSFKFNELLDAIEKAKARGAFVALSIDGRKFSGKKTIDLNIPEDLFNSEAFLTAGSSMLKRFQMRGEEMIGENVEERLLLTW